MGWGARSRGTLNVPRDRYDRPVTVAPARLPLLLDVDTGIDDALAILYLCASAEAELVAVTCVSGNVEAHQVAENTRAVLELAGRADVEVALGRTTPLVRPLAVAPETHGPKGIGYAELPAPTTPISERYGPDLIIEEARRRPGEVTLVTLGPVTNLAVAVLREPALPRLLRRWILMGGSYRSPGNTAPTTEWNAHCDPDALKVCLTAWAVAGADLSRPDSPGSGAPDGPGSAAPPASEPGSTDPGVPPEPDDERPVPRPIALGLDVTERAKLVPDHLVALARRAGSVPDDSLEPGRAPTGPEPRPAASNPVVRFVADALRFYMEFHSRYDGFYGAFIHDALAVAAALDPSLVRTEALAVDVELGGTLTTGETVADWRRTWGRPPNVDVAVEADATRFLERFVERVGDLAARRG
jgi:purine nucleosidase